MCAKRLILLSLVVFITELYFEVTKIHEFPSDEFVSRIPYLIPLRLKYFH
jgi:hypothetical protein